MAITTVTACSCNFSKLTQTLEPVLLMNDRPLFVRNRVTCITFCMKTLQYVAHSIFSTGVVLAVSTGDDDDSQSVNLAVAPVPGRVPAATDRFTADITTILCNLFSHNNC